MGLDQNKGDSMLSKFVRAFVWAYDRRAKDHTLREAIEYAVWAMTSKLWDKVQ